LKKARNVKKKTDPLVMEFQIGWEGLEKTPKHIAYVSDFKAYGKWSIAKIEFIAVDPASWHLNAGTGDGKVYTGRICDVIKGVAEDFLPSDFDVQCSETTDHKDGKWGMMRQDPKTFIKSLLDWSSSVTKKKTQWMVASLDKKLIIKEQADFPCRNIITLKAADGKEKNDVLEFEFKSNNALSLLQSSMVTQGISVVSGKFIDKQTDKDKAEVNDENTENKINARIGSNQGFDKPKDDFSTSIIAVPELSDGALGVKYDDSIDGRARQLYLSMLPVVSKMRLEILGCPEFHDSSEIGISYITLQWKDIDEDDFFLSGKWLVYGWVHYMSRAE
jgi:hypothetical protein